jgi:hypothetical protein
VRILKAFQEEGWPVRIDDPLPFQKGIDSKSRLRDTVKALNRSQQVLRFHLDGTGEGVRWELLNDPSSANQSKLPMSSP